MSELKSVKENSGKNAKSISDLDKKVNVIIGQVNTNFGHIKDDLGKVQKGINKTWKRTRFLREKQIETEKTVSRLKWAAVAFCVAFLILVLVLIAA